MVENLWQCSMRSSGPGVYQWLKTCCSCSISHKPKFFRCPLIFLPEQLSHSVTKTVWKIFFQNWKLIFWKIKRFPQVENPKLSINFVKVCKKSHRFCHFFLTFEILHNLYTINQISMWGRIQEEIVIFRKNFRDALDVLLDNCGSDYGKVFAVA